MLNPIRRPLRAADMLATTKHEKHDRTSPGALLFRGGWVGVLLLTLALVKPGRDTLPNSPKNFLCAFAPLREPFLAFLCVFACCFFASLREAFSGFCWGGQA